LFIVKLKLNTSHGSTRTQGSSSNSETVEAALDGRERDKGDASLYLDAIDGFDIARRDASARLTAFGSCGHVRARPAQAIQADEIFRLGLPLAL
jgi:hypothetical protein